MQNQIDKLLTIKEICTKLSISRSTFERMRRTHDVKTSSEFDKMPVFPKPSIVIGRSPRWSTKILNTWFEAVTSKGTQEV